MGTIPWMTPELLAWFRTKGFEVDCDTRKLHIITREGRVTNSWVQPTDPSAFRDRLSLLTHTMKAIARVKEAIKEDKAFFASMN